MHKKLILEEHSSANQTVCGLILGPVSKVMNYNEACIMHLTPGVVYIFQKALGV